VRQNVYCDSGVVRDRQTWRNLTGAVLRPFVADARNKEIDDSLRRSYLPEDNGLYLQAVPESISDLTKFR
jgi:hypothetical protein